MSMIYRCNTVFFQIAAAVLVAIALPVAAQAADAEKEIATAAEHAGYAAGSDTVAKVHLHLHHTINCLVGPDGDGFDAQSGNPCDGMGEGAMNDLGDDMADRKSSIEDALQLAKTGAGTDALEEAQSIASTVQNTLTESE